MQLSIYTSSHGVPYKREFSGTKIQQMTIRKVCIYFQRKNKLQFWCFVWTIWQKVVLCSVNTSLIISRGTPRNISGGTMRQKDHTWLQFVCPSDKDVMPGDQVRVVNVTWQKWFSFFFSQYVKHFLHHDSICFCRCTDPQTGKSETSNLHTADNMTMAI